MKIAQINVSCKGSIGKICTAVCNLLTENGVENRLFYALGNSDLPNATKYTDRTTVKLETLLAKVTGNYGFSAFFSTRRLIHELKRLDPDIVHIHNIHNNNVHLEKLFRYLKSAKKKVYWTFHDCWAFTGYCVYFDMCSCDKWKTNCSHCPQYKPYSLFFDRSKALFRKKRDSMEGLDLTVITPSQWMADLVKQSFLRDCPIKVINNGIDLDIFYPRKTQSIRKKFNCENKHLVLGLAYCWEKRKGLDVFLKMAQLLPDYYQIILVGTDSAVDRLLPENIISIHRTHDQHELAELYSTADVFAIPTLEDNYPTVNMEAIACGTPVVTYRTGGSPEMLDAGSGIVVERDDSDAFLEAVIHVCEDKPFSSQYCVKKAQIFRDKDCFRKYLDMYIQDYAQT